MRVVSLRRFVARSAGTRTTHDRGQQLLPMHVYISAVNLHSPSMVPEINRPPFQEQYGHMTTTARRSCRGQHRGRDRACAAGVAGDPGRRYTRPYPGHDFARGPACCCPAGVKSLCAPLSAPIKSMAFVSGWFLMPPDDARFVNNAILKHPSTVHTDQVRSGASFVLWSYQADCK